MDALVRYYRIVLSWGREAVMLREEMSMVAEYVRIQRFAYSGMIEATNKRELQGNGLELSYSSTLLSFQIKGCSNNPVF